MRFSARLLKELDPTSNAAAVFTTVGGSSMALGAAVARCLRWRRWPGELPEDRWATGRGAPLLLISVGIVFVRYAIVHKRLS